MRTIITSIILYGIGCLTVYAQWTYPEPITTGFKIAEDAYSTDTLYLYNVGAQAYFTEGNAWGVQASVSDSGLKLYFEKNIDDPEENDRDGKTYLIWDFSLYRNEWRNADVCGPWGTGRKLLAVPN